MRDVVTSKISNSPPLVKFVDYGGLYGKVLDGFGRPAPRYCVRKPQENARELVLVRRKERPHCFIQSNPQAIDRPLEDNSQQRLTDKIHSKIQPKVSEWMGILGGNRCIAVGWSAGRAVFCSGRRHGQRYRASGGRSAQCRTGRCRRTDPAMSPLGYDVGLNEPVPPGGASYLLTLDTLKKIKHTQSPRFACALITNIQP